MTMYAIQILGQNASTARTVVRGAEIHNGAPPDLVPDGYLAVDSVPEDPFSATLAVFPDRAAAVAAGDDARWNNQRFAIVPLGQVPGYRKVAGKIRRGEVVREVVIF